MADRYFSPADVEKLIPTLTRIMNDIMTAHTEASRARERLQAEKQRLSLAGGGPAPRPWPGLDEGYAARKPL